MRRFLAGPGEYQMDLRIPTGTQFLQQPPSIDGPAGARHAYDNAQNDLRLVEKRNCALPFASAQRYNPIEIHAIREHMLVASHAALWDVSNL